MPRRSVVRHRYDYSENKEGLKEVSLTGELLEAENDDDIAVGYKLTRHVASKKNDLKLTASTKGTKIYGEYNDNQLAEVGASREVEIGDQKCAACPRSLSAFESRHDWRMAA